MKTRLISGVVIVLSIPVAYGDNVTIFSEPGVTFLDSGSSTTDFSSAFTSANFLAAQTGTPAIVQTSTPFWVDLLTADPVAEWIGTDSTASTDVGDTALYAASFDIPDAFLSGSLTLNYAVDNELGDSNPGVYLNGTALPGSTGIGSFNTQYTFTDSNIGADLVQGPNWIYFDAVNLGAPAGLIFSANISTVNAASATPEPASVLLFGAGLIALGALSRRRRRCEGPGLT